MQEAVITEDVNSAFISTDLERLIRGKQIEKLCIVGTDHLVDSTARMAANLGVINATKDDGIIS